MSLIDVKTLSIDERIAIVCLFYAQLPSDNDRYKKSRSADLKLLAQRYCKKFRTLTNKQDTFDPLFENGRKGWYQRPLEKQSKFLHEIYEKYKEYTISQLEIAVNQIMADAKKDGKLYLSLKTKDASTVNAILNRNQNVEFDGINILQDAIKIGTSVFIVFGGDKPDWETGLVGMGVISKTPYDLGYQGRNFKIQVDIKLLLDKPIKREDLVPYKETYGIIGIAPITKWEPNQAISQVPEQKAIALMRAMLELSPSIENDLSNTVDTETIKRIKGTTVKFVPVEVDYQQSVIDGLKESIASSDDTETTEEQEQFDEYGKEDFLKEVFISSDDYDMLCDLLENKKNIILQGAPGVGKTFAAKRLAYSIIGSTQKKNRVKMVQFHQSYSYEDFIVGFKPTETGFVLKEGPFYDFCIEAGKHTEPFFFIIDEINRGNLSKIFGELLMLIEADKREESVNLLYKNEPFSIPKNVYIIGMMNTADRSLAMIDYALRRRFAFFEMHPAFQSEKFKETISGSCDKAYKLIDVIERINEDIKEDDSLGAGFQIGHSYFCINKPLDENDVKRIIKYELNPLISEYWFDEPDKVKQYQDQLNGVLK